MFCNCECVFTLGKLLSLLLCSQAPAWNLIMILIISLRLRNYPSQHAYDSQCSLLRYPAPLGETGPPLWPSLPVFLSCLFYLLFIYCGLSDYYTSGNKRIALIYPAKSCLIWFSRWITMDSDDVAFHIELNIPISLWWSGRLLSTMPVLTSETTDVSHAHMKYTVRWCTVLGVKLHYPWFHIRGLPNLRLNSMFELFELKA